MANIQETIDKLNEIKNAIKNAINEAYDDSVASDCMTEYADLIKKLQYIKEPDTWIIQFNGTNCNVTATVDGNQIQSSTTVSDSTIVTFIITPTDGFENPTPSAQVDGLEKISDTEFKITVTKNLNITFKCTAIPLEQYKYYYYSFTNNDVPSSITLDDVHSFTANEHNIDAVHQVCVFIIPTSLTATFTYTSGGLQSVVTECDSQTCLQQIADNDLSISNIPDGYKTLAYIFMSEPNIDSAKININ